MNECLIDGQILEHIHVSDRGLSYGDGLFETIPVVQGQPRWWQDHIDRMSTGCERLGLNMPPQALLLREAQTVSAGQHRCVVKIVLTRGMGIRGYAPMPGVDQTRIVSSHAWPTGLEEDRMTGVVARTCDLRLAIQPSLGGMKHLNRLEQVLASREMADYEGQTGILRDMDDHVISAVSANLFLVFGQQILTPRLDRSGVRGVLRARIRKVFKTRCELRRIMPEMLAEADEVFLGSTLRGIVPVTSIYDLQFSIGPVTRELQACLSELLD